MEKSIKRQHSAEFKRRVALELIKAEETMSAICSKYQIHPTQARKWKEKAVTALEHSFDSDSVDNRVKEKDKLIEELYNQIGKLKVEVDWLKKKIGLFS